MKLIDQILKDKKAILWDMDGVLLDSLSMCFIVTSNLISKYLEYNVDVPLSVIKKFFGLDHENFFSSIIKEMDIRVSNHKFNSICMEYSQLRYISKYELNPGVLKTLDYFKTLSLKQVVVSSNEVNLVNEALEKSNIINYFDFTLGFDPIKSSGKTLRKKPEADTYLYAMTKLDVQSFESIIIEDSVTGITAAKSSRAFVIGVTTGGISKELLLSLLKGSNSLIIGTLLDLYEE